MLNFDPNDARLFFLYYEKGELVDLLTVYADDQDVEVTILVHPIIAVRELRALFTSFERETASFLFVQLLFRQSVFF